MSTISVSLPADGSTADVADYNTPITTIVNAINGGLDNDNIATGAAISGTKLADASIDSDKYVDGSIDPEHLITGAGTSWAWQSWTPTWVNFTLGDGTQVAKYIQIGKNVYFRLNVVWGSTTSLSGTPTFTLPVASIALVGADSQVIAVGKYLDSGMAAYQGLVMLASTTTGQLQLSNASATYLTYGGISATTPINAWGTSDEFKFHNGMYEAA